MSTVPVNLQSYVETKAREGGFDSPADYIVSLISAASEQQSGLELALLTGLDGGPATEFTDDEWDDMRTRIESGRS